MTQTPDVPVVDTDTQIVETVQEVAVMETETENQTIETQTDVTGDAPLLTDVTTQTEARLPTRRSVLEEMLLEATQD